MNRAKRGGKRQSAAKVKSQKALPRLVPPNPKWLGPKLKQEFDQGRAVLVAGGAVDLLLMPCPMVQASLFADEASEQALAVPLGVTDDFATRRERIKASVMNPNLILAPVNYDSQIEEMLDVQKSFLKENPEVEKKFAFLREPLKPVNQSPAQLKKLRNGTFILTLLNNQRLIFEKPVIKTLGLNEDEVKKFLKPFPPEDDQKFGIMGCPPPLPSDAIQAQCKYEYMDKTTKTPSVVPCGKQCATAADEEEVDDGDFELGDEIDLKIDVDDEALEKYPD